MAAGGIVTNGPIGRAADYHGGMTFYVFLVCLASALGGLLFGYDVGVTGGVEAMADFQRRFFPDVYERTISGEASTDPYCTYNDHMLQLFSSLLFLAGAVIAFFAGYITRAFGRKVTMIGAGCSFLIGAGLNAGAANLAMLVVGRMFLGFGVGAASQVVPMYISETAPFKYRGGLNILFQLSITIGILVAQLINYGVQDLEWGWRLSLGLAGAPAIMLTIAGFLLPESPNSLVERGHLEKGRLVLEKLRGTKEVDAEFSDIVDASEQANKFSLLQSWANMFKRQYRPMFIVSCTMAALQQLTGINAIMFYVPVLFSSLGGSRSASLLNAVIVGGVNVVSTFVSIATVDRFGRRKLLLQGGVQMFLAQVVTAVLLAVSFSTYTTADLPKGMAIGTLVVICIFVAGFAWSWGPLVWVVAAEVQSLETRAAGMSATVFFNFIFTFLIGQTFLSMLCAFKYGAFLFFAGWVAVMTIFVGFLLPETKGIPIEENMVPWAQHRFWRWVMGPAADEILHDHLSRGSALKVAHAEAAKPEKTAKQ